MVANEACRDVDGVICGHIHHAVIHHRFGIRYMNCGDWVESCTALVEHADGRFEIISWFDTGNTEPVPGMEAVSEDEEQGIAA